MTLAVRPASIEAPGIEVQDVTVTFGSVPAVERAALRVARGQITALVGDAGCGKSTLLRLVAGLLRPDSGQVRICGLDQRYDSDAARERVGWVPQGAPTWPELSVHEALAGVAALQGMTPRRARTRTHELVHAMGLRGLTGTRTAGLSTATRHRLALAQALMHDPAVLVLDGLLDDCDDPERIEIGDHLRRCAADGVAVLISARSAATVADCAHRVLTMADGRIASAHDLSRAVATQRWRIVALDVVLLRQVLDLAGFAVDDVDTGEAGANVGAAGDAPLRAAVDIEITEEDEAVALLRSLVDAGVPVLSFTPLTGSAAAPAPGTTGSAHSASSADSPEPGFGRERLWWQP